MPWEAGHTVAYELAGTAAGAQVPGWLVAVTVAAYVLPAVYLLTLFARHGRTPYDRLSRTMVVRVPPPG